MCSTNYIGHVHGYECHSPWKWISRLRLCNKRGKHLIIYPPLLMVVVVVVVCKLALPNNKRDTEQNITLRYDKTCYDMTWHHTIRHAMICYDALITCDDITYRDTLQCKLQRISITVLQAYNVAVHYIMNCVHNYTIWCDRPRHDTTRHDMTRDDTRWEEMTCHDATWYDMTRHDTTWYDMLWYGMTWQWHDITLHYNTWHHVTSHQIKSHHMLWYDMTQYYILGVHMTWYGLICHDTTWSDIIIHDMICHDMTITWHGMT